MLPIYHNSSTWRQPQTPPPQQQQQQQQTTTTGFGPQRLALTHHGRTADPPVALSSADEMALADVPMGDRANQLAWRFAHMLACRHRARGLILVDDASEIPELSSSPPAIAGVAPLSLSRAKRKQNARSKNCAFVRRHPRGGKLSRLARAHAASHRGRGAGGKRLTAGEEEEEERRQLEATIRELRDTIASLEQSQLLADSSVLTWRANRGGVAVNICRQYFVQFANGYDSGNPAMAAHNATTRAFMASHVEPDVLSRDFQGVEAFLNQWQTYTTCYDNFSTRMVSITLVDDEDQYVSLRAAGEMRFSFSADSLKVLYPYLYQQMQTSAEVRAICEKLLGKECTLAFDIGMHFNQRGRVFVHESRVHMASALLNLMADPFAAMKVLNASLITEDGHWKRPDSNDIHENANELPKSIM